jgi:hypothetical protein
MAAGCRAACLACLACKQQRCTGRPCGRQPLCSGPAFARQGAECPAQPRPNKKEKCQRRVSPARVSVSCSLLTRSFLPRYPRCACCAALCCAEAQVGEVQAESERVRQQIEAAAAERRPLEERKAALEQ